MPKQVAVIGLGRFGAAIARSLYRGGQDVLAVDRAPAAVREITGDVTYPVEGDATDEQFLREVGILDYDVAVVAIGSDVQSSLLTTVLLCSLRGQPRRPSWQPFTVARAQDELHGNALSRLGADRVIQVEREAGEELVHLVSAPSAVRPYLEHYLSVTPEFSITRIQTPPAAVNQSLRDLRLGRPRDKYGLVIIAIRRGKGRGMELTLNPDEDEVLRQGDVLIVAGRTELLERLAEPTAESIAGGRIG